jgi:hypothetical protein
MMAKRRTAPARRRQSRQDHKWLWIGIASAILILIVVGLIFWPDNQPANEPDTEAGLPTPIGFPDSAQDVGTMVGQPAPAFTLLDETGVGITVTPGQTGRPIVLVFNMGLG